MDGLLTEIFWRIFDRIEKKWFLKLFKRFWRTLSTELKKMIFEIIWTLLDGFLLEIIDANCLSYLLVINYFAFIISFTYSTNIIIFFLCISTWKRFTEERSLSSRSKLSCHHQLSCRPRSTAYWKLLYTCSNYAPNHINSLIISFNQLIVLAILHFRLCLAN